MGNYASLFSNLVAMYDGTVSGTTLKNLVNPGTYDGTITGSPTIVANKFGVLKGIQFDGVDDYINTNIGITKPTRCALIVLFKTPGNKGGFLFTNASSSSYQNSFTIGLNASNGNISAYFHLSSNNGADGKYTSGGVYNNGIYCIAGVRNGDTASDHDIFINGIKQGFTLILSSEGATHTAGTPSGWYIGAYSAYNNIVNVSMDSNIELYTWVYFDVAKSDAEVAAISKLLLNKPIQNPNNLRAWWA